MSVPLWEDYQQLSSDQKLELTLALGEQWSDFSAETLSGEQELPLVAHVPTNIPFVVVPGGTFEMGFTEKDLAEVEKRFDLNYPGSRRFVDMILAQSRPTRTVTVNTFLLSGFLDSRQIKELSHGHLSFDAMYPDEMLGLSKQLAPYRLPSEAEIEYVMREGGSVTFVNNAIDLYLQSGRWTDRNAWGFNELTSNTWVADEWHETYVDAPPTAEAWTTGQRIEVFRGDLPCGPSFPDAALAALAALRGKWSPEQEREVSLRLAMAPPLA